MIIQSDEQMMNFELEATINVTGKFNTYVKFQGTLTL